MAIPPPDMLTQSWVRDAFLREYTYKPEWFTEVFRKRLPTVESIKADVAKLRSPSEAGRRMIEDRRMALASLGPWADTIIMGDRGRSMFVKGRQEGVAYRTKRIVAEE